MCVCDTVCCVSVFVCVCDTVCCVSVFVCVGGWVGDLILCVV